MTTGRVSRSQRSRAVVGAVLLAVLGAACGDEVLHVPPHVLVDRRGQAIEGASGPDDEEDFPIAFNSFLPQELTARPGGRIFFDTEFTGALHTVTFGTLVDEAVAAIEELGRGAALEEIEALPEMQKLPNVFPRSASDGRLLANRSATEPCYLDEGAPPNPPEGGAQACPERDRPAFDGTQTFYNFGWVKEDSVELSLSEDLPEGTYHFMCLVHRSMMIGTLEVVGPDEEVSDQPTVSTEASSRVSGLSSSLESVANDFAAATSEDAAAGASSPTGQAELTGFSPETIRISQGDTVSWTVSGLHAIGLEPDVESGTLLEEQDGEFVFNPDVVMPSEGAPPIPPRAQVFPPPPGGEPVALSASWDGQGPFNSGLLRGSEAVPVSYEVTFTQPGRYALQCLVHPLMNGVVEVE